MSMWQIIIFFVLYVCRLLKTNKMSGPKGCLYYNRGKVTTNTTKTTLSLPPVGLCVWESFPNSGGQRV